MFIVTNQCDIFFFDASLCGQAGFRAWCYLRSYASLCKNTMYRNEARALDVLRAWPAFQRRPQSSALYISEL